MNNLKMIGLALHNYHDTHGTFPPAVTYDANGKPMHSWRVLILPYLEQSALYASYNFNEPWDSPNNIQLQSRMPAVFSCPSSPSGTAFGATSYAGLAAPNSILNPQKSTGIREILDGTSNTLLVVEVDGANIPWTEPRDLAYVAGMSPSPGTMWSSHVGGLHILLADGFVKFIGSDIDPTILQGLTTCNGGERVAVP